MASEPKQSFAAKLTEIRTQVAKLSQYELAKRCRTLFPPGLSAQAISLLEKGEREPSWATVQILAKALGVDCRVFMDDGQSKAPVEEPPAKSAPSKRSTAKPAGKRGRTR